MKSTISQEQISETAVRLGIPDHPFVARRIARAFDLVETNKVNEVSHDDGFYRVHSQYDDKIYTVELNHGNPAVTRLAKGKACAPHCTCPDNERTIFCKHSIASMMVAQEQEHKAKSLIVKETAHNEKVKASWVVTDGKRYTNVWQDLNGKVCCVCGAYYKKDCVHKQAIRDYYDGGNGKGIVNDCGSASAKALQDKLNGNNGTGDNSSPVHHQLDVTNPFEESEQRDIDQINGNGWRVRSHALGDLVHKLSNGEYVISYRGILTLAEKHGVTFDQHTDEQEAKDTRTVIAHARRGNNTRASGKPMNGSFITAVELAKRNAARQLLPLPEIKALEKKAQLEADFDWQVAKRKCLEIVPDFTFEIIIHDLVKAGKLEQKHPSDYNRKEWLVIFDACKCDAETRVRSHAPGNDDDNGDGANTPSSDKFAECREAAKDFVRYSWLKADMLKEGVVSDDWTDDDIAKLKEACEIDASLFGKELGYWTVDIQPNTNAPYVYQRRYWFWLTPMTKRCFWCGKSRKESILPDTCIHWGRYEIKASLCLECSQKVGKGELDKDRIVQKFDDLYHVESHCGQTAERLSVRLSATSPKAKPVRSIESIPDNVDEFVERCKQAEATVEDTTDDANGKPLENDNGKRKLQMDKKLRTWLVEADGTKTEISCREICEQFAGRFVTQLRAGIDSGGDISTVELD